ncbi:MAG: hypothetical protein MZV63_17475 [Marinilabiliales bacterium]|nr:hypothetical protein [Marinilabiliales bacterium]
MSPSDIESISIIKRMPQQLPSTVQGTASGVVIITTEKRDSRKCENKPSRLNSVFLTFATEYRPFMQGDERRETIYEEGLVNEGLYYLGYDEAAATAHADANIE